MAHENVLIIDDSKETRDMLAEHLRELGYEVKVASDGSEGITMIDKEFFDVVLTDLVMPRVDGMAVLRYLVEHSPDSICIILTGHGSIKNAVEAIKAGAYDYLTKPLRMDEILLTLKRALDFRNLKRENQTLRNQLRRKYRFENIIGDSEKMQAVFETIEKVADSDSTVLILGESGTGKELIARAIHYRSYRREGPFVPVNCAAIPDELLESELFGHEKGAFTHAIRTRIGRLELANGGTLFLDEIGDMKPNLQSKLLRVLQERQFERVGGVKTITTDMRVIAATHQDLQEAVEQKRFREDLYYRLNVIPITLPPLRERKSDIPLLAHHFLHHFNRTKKKAVREIAPDAMERLLRYHWPGNVRELENTIERIVILSSSDVITVKDLPERFQTPSEADRSVAVEIPEGGISLDEAVNEFERRLILHALHKSDWVKSKAAQLLNVNRTTLIEKIKRQKLEPASDEQASS